MLRLILNATSNTIKIIRCASIYRYSQYAKQSKVRKERLEVTLCGQICEEPYKTKNGTIVVQLITRHGSDEFRTKHEVCIPPIVLKNVPVDRLNEGARIYLTGVIYYVPFSSAEGQLEQQGKILPRKIIPCEQNTVPTSDINDVILFGRVMYQPSITENVTFFMVGTMFYDPIKQENKNNLHTVMVRDDDEMRERANRLTAGDFIGVHGFLKLRHVRHEDGKYRGKYLVLPRGLVVCQLASQTASN